MSQTTGGTWALQHFACKNRRTMLSRRNDSDCGSKCVAATNSRNALRTSSTCEYLSQIRVWMAVRPIGVAILPFRTIQGVMCTIRVHHYHTDVVVGITERIVDLDGLMIHIQGLIQFQFVPTSDPNTKTHLRSETEYRCLVVSNCRVDLLLSRFRVSFLQDCQSARKLLAFRCGILQNSVIEIIKGFMCSCKIVQLLRWKYFLDQTLR